MKPHSHPKGRARCDRRGKGRAFRAARAADSTEAGQSSRETARAAGWLRPRRPGFSRERIKRGRKGLYLVLVPCFHRRWGIRGDSLLGKQWDWLFPQRRSVAGYQSGLHQGKSTSSAWVYTHSEGKGAAWHHYGSWWVWNPWDWLKPETRAKAVVHRQNVFLLREATVLLWKPLNWWDEVHPDHLLDLRP